MPETAKRRVPPEPTPEPEPVEPPFYEATEPLRYPARWGIPPVNFLPGDRVSPADVAANGWGNQVKVPDRFAGVLAPLPAGDAPGARQAGDSSAGEEQ